MKTRVLTASVVFLAFCAVMFAVMLYGGAIQPNRAKADKYPIHGVDVSSYQGTIDWNLLAK